MSKPPAHRRTATDVLDELAEAARLSGEWDKTVRLSLTDRDWSGKFQSVANAQGPAWRAMADVAADAVDYFGFEANVLSGQWETLYDLYHDLEAQVDQRGGRYSWKWIKPRRQK